MRPRGRAVAWSILVWLSASLASCADPAVNVPAKKVADAGHYTDPTACIQAATELPLIGAPGDSPLVPVEVDGHKAAMFFSPGYALLLLRQNGAIHFERERYASVTTPDGDKLSASITTTKLTLGNLPPLDEGGYILPEPDTRSIDGRPIVGMIGRDILANNVVVDLDIPRRRVIAAVLRNPRCPQYDTLLVDKPPLTMQREILYVSVRIDGRKARAILEPDLPVSAIPTSMAADFGITDAMLARAPSVRTKFGARVRGRRVRIASLEIGATRLNDITVDVEDGIDDILLGLNVFARGEAVFDFERGKFWFHTITDTIPPPGALHFDDTKVAHVAESESERGPAP